MLLFRELIELGTRTRVLHEGGILLFKDHSKANFFMRLVELKLLPDIYDIPYELFGEDF
jgi:hypothetical protein